MAMRRRVLGFRMLGHKPEFFFMCIKTGPLRGKGQEMSLQAPIVQVIITTTTKRMEIQSQNRTLLLALLFPSNLSEDSCLSASF